MTTLPDLIRGEGWVWSPEANFGPVRLRFPMFGTFDSFAAQQLQKKVSGKGWATVDLEEVKSKLAAVIEKRKAEDPKELARIIAELRKQIAGMEKKGTCNHGEELAAYRQLRTLHEQAGREAAAIIANLKKAVGIAMKFIAYLKTKGFFDATTGEVDEVVVRKAVEATVKDLRTQLALTAKARNRELEGIRAEAERLIGSLKSIAADDKVEVQVKVHNGGEKEAPVPAPRRETAGEGDGLSAMARAILTSLAQHSSGLSKAKILLHTGYSASGSVSKMFATLTREALIEPAQSGEQKITDAGLAALGEYEKLPTGNALREFLLKGNKLSTMEKALLKTVCETHPDSIMKKDILERAGYSASGSVSKSFARLVRYGYLAKSGNGLIASEALFDKKP